MVAWVVIDIDTEDADLFLMKLARRLSDPGLIAYMNTVIDPYLRNRASERFASLGDDAVGQWRPITRFTQEVRVYRGHQPQPPMQETGELMDWITNSELQPYSVPDGVAMDMPSGQGKGSAGVVIKYLAAQLGVPINFWGDRRMPPVPPRPVVGASSTDLLNIMSATQGYLMAP